MKKTPKIDVIKDRYTQTIWHTPDSQMSATKMRLVVAVRIAQLVLRDLMDGMITLRAMGLVYTTILALVPLLAVSFSVLKGFGVHNQVEPMLLNMFQPLGEKGVEVTAKIIEFVDNTKAGVLGTLGLALLMYTVVSLLQKIERAFNYTWRVSHHRPIRQRFTDYIALVLIGPVMLFSALGVTASVANIDLIQDVMEIETIGSMFALLGRLIPYIMVIATFTFVYMLVPNTKVKVKSALVGGIVAGGLWETASWAFTAFVVNSANYTAIYSAFASLIIFFIWLYINWLILLVGCNISFYYQQPAHRHPGSRIIRLSNRLRESIALNIMLLTGRRYYNKEPAFNIESLSEQMNIGSDTCELVINRLLKAKLLLKTSDTPATYIPAHDMDTILLDDIVFSARVAEENTHLSLDDVNTDTEINKISAEIEKAIAISLKGKTLKELSVGKSKRLNNSDIEV